MNSIWRFRFGLIVVFCVAFLVIRSFPPTTLALDVSNGIEIKAKVDGSISLVFMGVASPYAIIKITTIPNNVFSGEYPANGRGEFTIIADVNVTDPITTFCLTSTDIEGNSSAPLCYEYTFDFDQGDVSQIIFPPTIRIDRLVDDSGVRLSGYSLPNAKITVLLDNEILQIALLANQFGYYSTEIEIGSDQYYKIKTSAESATLVTGFSQELQFRLIREMGPARIVYLISEVPGICYNAVKAFATNNKDIWWLLIILFELIVLGIIVHHRHTRKRH